MRGRRLAIALLGFAALCAAGVAYAAFTAKTSNPASSIMAKRIYPGDRVDVPVNLHDFSSGSDTNASHALAFADQGQAGAPTPARYRSAANMVVDSNAYVDFDFGSVLAAGISVSSATVNIRIASQGGIGSGNACIWYQVISGGTTLATRGSYSDLSRCGSGTTYLTFSDSISEITDTDQVNGTKIRVYGWETSGLKRVDFDQVTITGTVFSTAFTSYPDSLTDTSTSPSATATWDLVSADTTFHTAASNWPGAASTTKYLRLTFDPSVPTGAVITAVKLTNSWRPSANVTNGGTLCYYFGVFNGATQLANHGGGTQATAISCKNTTAGWQTDANISLPEVDTVAEANNLVLRLYYWISPTCGGFGNPACVKSVTDQLQVTYTYYLD
jgi:hypothetical protein